MEITHLDKSSYTISKETAWLAEVIDCRLRLYFNDNPAYNDIREISPPDVENDRSYYAETIRELQLSFDERLVLILALVPHIQPQLLDVFFIKNATYDRGFTEFGGLKGKSHSGFIPTAETAVFLLGGADIERRLHVHRLLRHSVAFTSANILKLHRLEYDEPLMSSLLTCTDDFIGRMEHGGENKVDFSASFPAKHIHTPLEWQDLVVEHHVREDVEEIRIWIERGEDMLGRYPDMRKKLKPGYRSLFYGPPGTGKTLTACLLGKATGRDVYRIDLSLIVSKYIGETEKNLSNVFDQAEHKKWILFFDEADALFGKRTQATSSHDRYANQEVSYLLQRIEDFPGIVLLATNLKMNIDEAFSRRFQSMVHFPMPGYSERLVLWQHAFGHSDMLAHGVDLEKIAKAHVLSGGSIMNILQYCIVRAMRQKKHHISYDDIIAGISKELQKDGRTI